MMQMVTGAGGVQLATYGQVKPGKPAVLCIHGWAQHALCWEPVMERLASTHHVVAMDLRGHGASDKPDDVAAYTDTKLWGDDVAAVIAAHNLVRPVLVGWSYGSRVIASYLATHGDADIAGVVLAGGIAAIGSAREDWMVGAASPGLDRDLYTEDQRRRLTATARFVDNCTAKPLDRQIYGELVGANMLVPPLVRRALFAADWDMRPTYAAMTCPGLAIHGAEDRVVSPATGEAIAEAMPRARYVPYEGVGHAPFLEAPERFATDLAAFTAECQNQRESSA